MYDINSKYIYYKGKNILFFWFLTKLFQIHYFFYYFKTLNIIKFFVHFLYKLPLYYYDDLLKVYDQSLKLKIISNQSYKLRKILKFLQDLEIKEMVHRGHPDITSVINVDYEGYNNEVQKLKA